MNNPNSRTIKPSVSHNNDDGNLPNATLQHFTFSFQLFLNNKELIALDYQNDIKN